MKEVVVELSKFKPLAERRKSTWDEYFGSGLLGGIPNNPESEPYTIAFCYLPKLCLVVKGLYTEVRLFVDNLPACSYYTSMWKQGKHRGYWRLNANAETKFALHPHRDEERGRRLYQLYRRSKPNWELVAEMRRVPRAYLKELAE